MVTFGTPVNSAISVTGRTGNAPANASVNVSITHPRRGELQIDLIAPDSTVFPLKASNLADPGKSVPNVVYSVDLSSKPLNGAWTLRVQDIAAGNDGVLSNWSITF